MLTGAFGRVKNLSDKRKKDLEVAKKYYEFLQNTEEEERWALEKIGLCRETDIGKDLNGVCVLLKRHEVSVGTSMGYVY